MLVKNIIETDFVNYKVPSMYIAFPFCDFKCDRENGSQLCQNWSLTKQNNIEISAERILELYKHAQYGGTKAILCCGLEPLYKSFDDVLELLKEFRKYTEDDFVIYTGYTEDEVSDKIDLLKQYNNVIVKFGRFRPGHTPHYDETLGISLASDNQYGKKIS